MSVFGEWKIVTVFEFLSEFAVYIVYFVSKVTTRVVVYLRMQINGKCDVSLNLGSDVTTSGLVNCHGRSFDSRCKNE